MAKSGAWRRRRPRPEATAAARGRLVAVTGRAAADEEGDQPMWHESISQERALEPPYADAGPAVGGQRARHAARAKAVLSNRRALADRLPPTLRRGRLALEPRSVAAVAVVGLLAVLLGGWYLWRAEPRSVLAPARSGLAAVAAPSSTPPAGALPTPVPTPAPGASPTASGVLVVDVSGAVHRPGVVRLPAGSRVVDALRAAGGTGRRADTTGLNLAQVLSDGEQVLVPRAGAAAPPAGGTTPGAGAPSAPGTPVDLNTATLDQLDALPGIGPVLAQRILDWREQNGAFTSVDELQEVSGIGEATFGDLVGLVRV